MESPGNAKTPPVPGSRGKPASSHLKPAGTPDRRAKSHEPPSGRGSIHTPVDNTLRNLGSSAHKGLSASGRRNNAPTPHARAAFRAIDQRRAAVFTPGKNRRRSVRDQRDSPRDILRGLSRALAPGTAVIGSSPHDQTTTSSIISEGDEDDELPIDRPRLSLPLDVDDDSDLVAPRSSGLEEENYTIEFPRRAVSEQPSRLSMGSMRLSNYFNGEDINEEDTGAGFFPQAIMEDLDERLRDDVTFERIDEEAGRRETLASARESDFGFQIPQLDADQSTFVMAMDAQSSPARQPLNLEPIVGDDEGEQMLEDELENQIEESLRLMDDMDVDVTGAVDEEAQADPSKAGRKRKKGVKLSRHNIEYPSLPPALVKRLAQNFAKTSGISNSKIAPDTLAALMQASDWFFQQLGDDLSAYAKHAKRKTIDETDMVTLMRRQRQISSTTSLFSLAQRHLPRELLQEIRMPAPVVSKQRRRTTRGEAEQDEEVT